MLCVPFWDWLSIQCHFFEVRPSCIHQPLTPFTAESSSVMWMCPRLCKHLPIEVHLSSFRSLATRSRAAVSTGEQITEKKKMFSRPWDQGPRVQLLSHVVSLGLSEFTCGCGRTRDIPPSNAWVIHLFLTSLPEFGIITNFFKSRSGSSVVRACCMFRLHLADGSWRWTPFHSSTWQLCSFLGDTTLSVHFLTEYFKMLSFQSF